MDVVSVTLEAKPRLDRGRAFAWFFEAPLAARRGLVAAWVGWMLDGFDIMLYSMVLTAVLTDFRISKATAGLLGSLTLVASALGGITFGIIADKHGRRAAMQGSILVYSIFTAACGLAQTVWQLALFRFILGLGMGGEWTSGASLVSESFSNRDRGKALGWMQSAWAVGYAAAALVAAVILPRWGWRATFFVGIMPSVFAIWIRRHVQEPAIWLEKRARRASGSTTSSIFDEHYRRLTVALTSLSLCTLFAYWALNLWIPTYLSLPTSEGGLGFSAHIVTAVIVVMQAGTWLGYISFGYVADVAGRKRSFVGYLLVAAALVTIYAHVRDPLLVFILGPAVAFFGTGYFSGFGAITAEIYPTSIRATAQGFTFNMGRVGSAIAPFVVGSLAQTRGFGSAFAMTAAALLLGATTWVVLPETHGRDLA